MSERSKRSPASGKSKVSKAKSVSVKPGIKSNSVKRSGCFKDRPTKTGKKTVKKVTRPKPGYSLYSSDSEDPISSLNCGIDKCSELLANLIQRKKGSQWSRPEISVNRDENRDVISIVNTPRMGIMHTPNMTPSQQRDKVFIPTAGTESPDTAVANMVDGRLARSRAPLVEVRTPFNQRLVSSTPDPERNLEDEDGYAQLIPQRDTDGQESNTARHGGNNQETGQKRDTNQNYIKDCDQFEKGFRPVSFYKEDFMEGVKQFEDSFPACHNRKSSIGDFQYYLPRESTGFSPPLFGATQDQQDQQDRADEEVDERERLISNGSHGDWQQNKHHPASEDTSQKAKEDVERGERGSTDWQHRESYAQREDMNQVVKKRSLSVESESHNRDYLEPGAESDDPEAYSAPVFNRMQVKMFGPGYRRRGSMDADEQQTVEAEVHNVPPSKKTESSRHSYPPRREMNGASHRRQDPMHTQYDLSQKYEQKFEQKMSWSEQVPHEEHGHFKQALEMHSATPMPSPARHASAEPRAILGRHVSKNNDAAVGREGTEDFGQQSEFVHQCEPEMNAVPDTPHPDVNTARPGKHVQFHLSKQDIQEENYPSSLINPSTLNSNVCISKPVAAQLPMLETPANSPVSHASKKHAKDLRESTLRKMAAKEKELGHEPHMFSENPRQHKGASDNLERRFKESNADNADQDEMDNYECEIAPFQPDLDQHWTVTPMNSPAPMKMREPRAGPPPAQRGPAALIGHTPGGQLDAAPHLPVRVDAVTGPKRLRYLMKELAEIYTATGDSDAEYVLHELEECVESIPQLKPTFNLQTEIDLLMQPLRSDNSQLRRRLRIVNQQLKERERQEKENTNHGINFEMLHLQTDNASLQRQLKEEKEMNTRLNQEMERLKYERQRMVIVLSDKENEGVRIKEQCTKEIQKLQFELELARKQTEGKHLRHAASESENRILQVSLKQRDLEINRLQDLVQTLKDGVGEVLRSLDTAQAGGIRANTDSSFSLQKMLLLLNKQGAMLSPTKSVMSDPGQTQPKKEMASSTKRNLNFDKSTSSASRKTRNSGLSTEALQQHDKVHKSDPVSLEKEFQIYMSPFNSSPKSDRGSVTEMLLRNCSGQAKDPRCMVKQSGGLRPIAKIPQPNFDTSDSGHETEGTPVAAGRTVLSSQPPPPESLQSEAFKGTELDLSLSTIEEDVRSVVSAVTSTTSLSTVDDRAFKDGIAALDANIAKVLNALEKTKMMFS